MMDDIYNSRILEFAGNIPRIGTLADAHGEAWRMRTARPAPIPSSAARG